jgi:hypothetical protein
VKLLQEVGEFLAVLFLGDRYGEVLPCPSWVIRTGIGLQVHGNVTSKHVNLPGSCPDYGSEHSTAKDEPMPAQWLNSENGDKSPACRLLGMIDETSDYTS